MAEEITVHFETLICKVKSSSKNACGFALRTDGLKFIKSKRWAIVPGRIKKKASYSRSSGCGRSAGNWLCRAVWSNDLTVMRSTFVYELLLSSLKNFTKITKKTRHLD